MQLQYVLANPAKKKAKKSKKKVLKTRDLSKLINVRGNSVKKKKKKKLAWQVKDSLAAKRHMAKIRAKVGRNPKKKAGKKKKNPFIDVAEIPKKSTTRKLSKKYYSPGEIAEMKAGYDATRGDLTRDLSKLTAKEIALAMFLGDKKKKAAIRKLMGQEGSQKAAVERAIKTLEAKQKFEEEVRAKGGKIVDAKFLKKNPKGRGKMKKKKARRKSRKAKRNPKLVQVNPARKRRRRKSRKIARNPRRKSSKYMVKMVGRAKLSKKAAKSISRRRRLGVLVGIKRNPDFKNLAKDLLIPTALAVGAYIGTSLAVSKIEAYFGVSLAQKVAALPVVGATLAPYAGTIASLGVAGAIGGLAMLAQKRMPASALGSNLGKVAMGTAAVALTIGLVTAGMQGAQKLGLAGVMYFPGMGSADFGMYPQMGDGYKQSAGDFGVIPEGLRGIPEGMRGVEFFPTNGMGQVQFYPQGADGDDMYRQSESGDLMEAEGLGNADFGVIPAGMEHMG